jgi:hypothetical protein
MYAICMLQSQTLQHLQSLGEEASGHFNKCCDCLFKLDSEILATQAKQLMCALPAHVALQEAAAFGTESQAGSSSSSSSEAPQPDKEFGVRVGQLGRGFII